MITKAGENFHCFVSEEDGGCDSKERRAWRVRRKRRRRRNGNRGKSVRNGRRIHLGWWYNPGIPPLDSLL